MLKGSLLSKALMLKLFPLQIPKRVDIFVLFEPETPLKWIWRLQTPERHVFETEHVAWAIKRANRSRMAAGWRDEETEKGRAKVTKPWNSTTEWRRPLWTDLNQVWCDCRSHQRHYVSK